MTFIVKDPELYAADWRETGAGPFRIRGQVLDYRKAPIIPGRGRRVGVTGKPLDDEDVNPDGKQVRHRRTP